MVPSVLPRALMDFISIPEDDAEDISPAPVATVEDSRTMLSHNTYDFEWRRFPDPPISLAARKVIFAV